MECYQVGGAVRDRLLGRTVVERDWVVVGASPKEMRALGYKAVGKDFPVFLHPRTREEYALARTERKTAPGYKGFVFHTSPDITLEEDLLRRDLTINAMAQDESGAVIDPFHGREDLAAGILRHVSSAFAEDPVRILRVARFAARFDFEVAAETMALMQGMVAAGEVDALTVERVWAELEKALGEAYPVRFFEVLRDCGALARLIPELDRLWGVPQSPESHPEVDTGMHVMLVLEQSARLSPLARVRFAALTHDLGKGSTPPAEWPRHRGHEERSVGLVQDLCRRYRVPNAYRELALLTARYHGRCHDALALDPAGLLDLLLAVDALRRSERFEEFLLACEADFRGRPGYESQPYPQVARLRAALAAAAGVDPRPLAARGLTGKAMAAALADQRREAIGRALADRRDPTG